VANHQDEIRENPQSGRSEKTRAPWRADRRIETERERLMAQRDEIQAQIAALQKQLEAADGGDELWVKDPKTGHETKLTGAHAQKWLRRLGLDDDEDTGDDDGEGQDPPPSGGNSVWGRKSAG
jgi:hypothetical protein